MEVVTATFMDAVTRIDVPTAVMTYNLSELELYIGKAKIVVSFWENIQTQPWLLVLANFISCLPSWIARDTAFIPTFLKRGKDGGGYRE